MKKSTFLRLICFIICSVFVLVACAPLEKVTEFFADDGTGHIFKISLDSDPGTLDPQLADDPSAVTVSKNLYAGLMEYDEEGRLCGRLAKDYEISSDGLKYTFYLEEGYKWHSLEDFEAPVTARDFVFAFQRLMDPKTSSPHSDKYFCISGARAVKYGGADPETLGVKALDDYTLEFTLEYKNTEFLALLAELPAMPCCKEFFTLSKGKYGLEAEAICTNGPFYVRYWLHDPYGSDNYVRLRRNPGYSEKSFVSAGGVNYLIEKDAEKRLSDFDSGVTDAIVFTAGSFQESEGETICGYSATAGIIFNEDVPAFSDPAIRQLFSWGIDREALNSSAPEKLISSSSLVPETKAMLSRGHASPELEDVGVSDLKMAEYKWSFLLDDGRKSELIGKTVIVPSSFGYNGFLEELTDSWYSAFGIHFSIEIVNDRDYAEKIKNKDFDIAVVSVSSLSGSPLDFIRPFGDGSFGIRLEKSSEALSQEGRFETPSELNFSCRSAESEILSEYHFIPLWSLPTVCAFDDDAEGLRLEPYSNTVLFEDAKMF